MKNVLKFQRKASIREMNVASAIALIVSVVGLVLAFGPDVLGGLLADVTFWCIGWEFSKTMQVELGITLRNHSRKV